MAYTREHPFDEAVIDRINEYIEKNGLSHSKIAKKAGMTYQKLYQLRHHRMVLKLREYVKLCEVFDEPFDKFVCGIDTKSV